MIKDKEISCYLTDHKYYSIGSLDRLPTTEKYFKNNNLFFWIETEF